MTHYAISDDGTDVRFECAAPPEAECRWECDCEWWDIGLDPDGTRYHIDRTDLISLVPPVFNRLHPMRPADCQILPWLENQECGPVDAGDMEAHLIGRHEIYVEWNGLEEGWYWEYAEGES